MQFNNRGHEDSTFTNRVAMAHDEFDIERRANIRCSDLVNIGGGGRFRFPTGPCSPSRPDPPESTKAMLMTETISRKLGLKKSGSCTQMKVCNHKNRSDL